MHVVQEAFNGQEMGSMEELRNTAPIPKPVLQVISVLFLKSQFHFLMCWLFIVVC